MLRKTILLILAFCFVSASYAFNIKGLTKKKDKAPDIDVVTWVGQEADNLPMDVDGVVIFRPNIMNEDGRVAVGGSVALPSVNQLQAFISGYVCANDMLDSETEDAIDGVDFDKKRFSVYREIREGEYQKASVYRFITDYSFADGKMIFSTHDINIEYKEKGILTRKVNIEKLKPATNERHRELIEGFNLANSRIVDGISRAIRESKSLKVTHWTEIKAGKVVKGMNETEVRLIGGTPRSINPSGDRTQWMYSNDFIVIFTDGIVTNVIQ